MNYRILIADDDPVSQEILGVLLRYAGYSVDIVADGSAALEAVRQGTYALVLLDIKLPSMNGCAVATAIINEVPISRRPWIVAISALMNVDEAHYQPCGFDACLTKPVRRTSLIACIEKGIAGRLHLL